MLRNLFQRACKAASPNLNSLVTVSPIVKSHANLYSRSLSHQSFQAFSSGKPPKGFEKFARRKKAKPAKEDVEKEEKEEDEQVIEIEKENEKIYKRTEKHETEKKERVHEEEKVKPRKEAKKQEEEEEMEEEEERPKKRKPRREEPFGFREKKEKEGSENDPKGKPKIEFIHMLGIGGLVASIYVFFSEFKATVDDISYMDFVKNYLAFDLVKSISVTRQQINGNYVTKAELHTLEGNKFLTITNLDMFLEEIDAYNAKHFANPAIPITFNYKLEQSASGLSRYLNILMIAGLAYFVFYFTKDMKNAMKNINQNMGGGGFGDAFGTGKSQVKIYGLENKVKQRFKDVAGLDEAKVEITEFVEFLKKPKKFKEMGAKIPRGALLAGPPGTGKTLLAKAAAGEAGVPFLSISGSDFVEMFVGVGASRVRDLFKKAKEHAPSIIFIDEIDAVGRKRESKAGGGNSERENTLNQLLVEMDGFGTEANVIILAATNRKELLDPALTRPGRFDRSIEITLPDIEGRKQIFMVHLKPLKLDPQQSMDEYAKRLATLTPGFSGADIANLCNEAAILAARHNKTFVSAVDFESATERVIGGLEKKGLVSKEEKKVVAIHESGHAVVSWFLEGGAPLLKLTIIPRSKGSLGFAQYLPNESSLSTKEELIDRICCVLGGRCAEELFNNKITTGASDDLRKAYQYAEAIVTKYGMSEKIGFVGFPDRDYGKAYSDLTGSDIDEEIKNIVDHCKEKTRELVRKHRDEIEKLSTLLLEKESLDLQQIIGVLGQRPFEPKSNFKAYLEYKTAQEHEIEDIKEKEKHEIEEEESEKKEEEEENKEEEEKEEKEEASTKENK